MLKAHRYSLRVTRLRTMALQDYSSRNYREFLNGLTLPPYSSPAQGVGAPLKGRTCPPLLPIRPRKHFRILYNVIFCRRFPIKDFRHKY